MAKCVGLPSVLIQQQQQISADRFDEIGDNRFGHPNPIISKIQDSVS